MENKNIIIIAVVVVAVIAIAGFVFTTGILNGENKNVETTSFDTGFMEGSFVGKTKLADKDKYMYSFEDKENKITYNLSTIDDSDAMMDIFYLQGVMNPEQRTINGNDWNIYFSQAVPGDNPNATNETMNIIICQSQGEKQGYFINVIIDADSKVNATLNTYGESYTDFVEPLLKSVTLKETKNVPKLSEQYGLSEDEFQQQMELVQQVKAGNSTAIEQVFG